MQKETPVPAQELTATDLDQVSGGTGLRPISEAVVNPKDTIKDVSGTTAPATLNPVNPSPGPVTTPP